ncbi:CDC48, partial [Symbiodinium sp. KB8]
GCDAPGKLATALTQHTPAALASLAASGLSVRPVVPDPALALDSVGGAGDAKAALLEAVVWPRLHPKELKAAGIAPARGVLLYGPPGCGKTLLAKAAASTLAVPFLPVFRVARAASPCVLFLDEVQAMFQKRSGGGGEGAAALAMQNSLTSQLLTELMALTALPGIGVVVMAATNVPGALDPALLRPGRLERCIPVTLPDAAERQTILASVTAKLPCPCEGAGVPGLDLASLAAATAGFSGADLAALVQSCVAQALAAQAPLAAMEAEDPLGLSALKVAVTPSNISQDALLQAAARMQPSVSRQQLQDLAQWERGVH